MDDIEVIEDIIRAAIGADVDVDRPLDREHQDAWDSLRHIDVVLGLESAFNVRFEPEEFGALDSVDTILATVERHRAT